MKYGVCVGLNDYPGTDHDLSQCVNDMNRIATRLELVGFDVVRIKDQEATTANFMVKVRSMAARAVSGDEIVISYSGHGSYQPDENGDEPDTFDEVICLYDRDFSDDEFRVLLNEFKDGVKITVILDSCFSGTATRAMLFGQPRRVKFRPPKSPLAPPVFRINKSFLRSDEESMNHILLSGCSDTEYSYEGSNGGAFTNALCAIVDNQKRINGSINFATFAALIKMYLPSREFPQTPQVEGRELRKNDTMPFFNTEEKPPVRLSCWQKLLIWLNRR
jgi:hypothetical protein